MLDIHDIHYKLDIIDILIILAILVIHFILLLFIFVHKWLTWLMEQLKMY